MKNKPQILFDIISQILAEPELFRLLPVVLNSVIMDLIFQRFEIEEEQMISFLIDPRKRFPNNVISTLVILDDPEIQFTLSELEVCMLNLLRDIENFPLKDNL